MGQVSIITRTKDRPITLKRAFMSVHNQVFRDFEWIIVNDGGSPESVNDIAKLAENGGIEVRIIHHAESLGMEAASNSGLRNAHGEFVVIHDDDDTWEPDFLNKTVSSLIEQRKDNRIRGVLTRSTVIEETIDHDRNTIIKVNEHPHEDKLDLITLFQIARPHNNFPPISFLYERAVLDEIGFYREDLPVLGDWEFNLRFLRRYDIAVIPEYLANYHIRHSDKGSHYSNSIVGASDKHKKYYCMLCNELLRQDLEQNQLGLGFMVNLCSELQETWNRNYNKPLWRLLYRKVRLGLLRIQGFLR